MVSLNAVNLCLLVQIWAAGLLGQVAAMDHAAAVPPVPAVPAAAVVTTEQAGDSLLQRQLVEVRETFHVDVPLEMRPSAQENSRNSQTVLGDFPIPCLSNPLGHKGVTKPSVSLLVIGGVGQESTFTLERPQDVVESLSSRSSSFPPFFFLFFPLFFYMYLR